jgi:hypothetical protein
MRGLSVRLARTGRVDFIGMDTLNQHIGRVMQLREFNLDSDIVETPGARARALAAREGRAGVPAGLAPRPARSHRVSPSSTTPSAR